MRKFMAFINLKVNIIPQVEFEFPYNNVTVQQINKYATDTHIYIYIYIYI